MIVQVMNKVYKMTNVQADEVLKVAKEQIPFGIYAVKKGNMLIMCRDKASSKTQLKKMIRDYKAKGFTKVYSNGL